MKKAMEMAQVLTDFDKKSANTKHHLMKLATFAVETGRWLIFLWHYLKNEYPNSASSRVFISSQLRERRELFLFPDPGISRYIQAKNSSSSELVERVFHALQEDGLFILIDFHQFVAALIDGACQR